MKCRNGKKHLFFSAPIGSTSLILFIPVALLLLSNLMAYAASRSSPAPTIQNEWRTGYWIWRMSGRQSEIVSGEADFLYVDAGSIYPPRNQRPMAVTAYWPLHLPKAAFYFALLRAETPSVPLGDVIPEILRTYRGIKDKASEAGQRVEGLQLDIDCPTDSLGEYARFLEKLRAALNPDEKLSITALLDWFRPDTKVSEVLQQVDEYVPQFYDVGGIGSAEDSGIAIPVDSSRWATVFNSYSRPYKIGIATFGRISSSCIGGEGSGLVQERKFIREYDSYDFIREKGLKLVSESHSKSGEKIYRFDVPGRPRLFLQCSESKEMIEVVVPTRDSVFSAYDAAKQFGGFCNGAIFFRWPSRNEALILQPQEVRRILDGKESATELAIEAEDGFCAAVSCSNIYLQRIGNRFLPTSISLHIRSSSNLDYFVPREALKTRLAGPKRIEITLPPFTGEPRVYLGRAVSKEPVTFGLEEK